MHRGACDAIQIRSSYLVRFSAGEDDSVAVVPNCCKWDGNGITTIPATSINASAMSDAGTHEKANRNAVQFPCFYQVRFSADPDEPVAVVPSCCVWTGNGLNMIPAKVGTDSATLDLQRVAGEPLVGSSTVFCLLLHHT